MSFDLEVWSVRRIGESSIPTDGEWRADGTSWASVSQKDEIRIWRSDRVLAEDIPDGVGPALAGISFVTRLTMSGKLSDTRLRFAWRLAKALAAESHGVVFDPQSDAIVTPSGVKRFVPFKKSETYAITMLSWWSIDADFSTARSINSLITIIERLLTEVLPRRYGAYEPPQIIYDPATGREHFIKYLEENAQGTIVWYPSRPVASVFFHSPSPIGPSKRGFRANHFEIGFESAALRQPGWESQVKQLWRAVSCQIRPLYGDVRTLDGYVRRGGITRGTELHPVTSWWWRGIPKTLGHAVVLGRQYQDLWPTFVDRAEVTQGLAFISGPNWTEKADIGRVLGGVPDELRQPEVEMFPITSAQSNSSRDRYPGVWPFTGPYAASPNSLRT